MTTTAAKILGSQPIEVEMVGGGQRMLIALRPLSIRQLLTWCEYITTEKRFELVLLCTGKPAEFIDQLTPASFAMLYGAAFNENFVKATPMIQADPTLANVFLPLVRKMQYAALEVLSLNGKDSLPELSSLESVAANGIESSTSALTNSAPSSAPATS